jgi:hypothetical protein
MAGWILSGRAPRACATTQTLALAGLAAARLGAATTYAGDPERLLMRSAAMVALAWLSTV